MFCPNCNQEVRDDAVFCPHCGTALDKEEKIIIDNPEVIGDDSGYHPGQYSTDYDTYQETSNSFNPYDRLSALMGILVFLFPIVGIIIYFKNRNQLPNKASTALKWALVSIAINIVAYIFF